MANYEEARDKLTNTPQNKLKSAIKNKTGALLRITKKNFQDEGFQHELFLTTRQKPKIRNYFAKNMLTDMKLNKAQLSKIIPGGRFLRILLRNLGTVDKDMAKEAIADFGIPLDKDVLSGLFSRMASNVT